MVPCIHAEPYSAAIPKHAPMVECVYLRCEGVDVDAVASRGVVGLSLAYRVAGPSVPSSSATHKSTISVPLQSPVSFMVQ